MVTLTHLVGILLALGAGLALAAHHLFVRMSTDEGEARDAILVVMTINLLVLLPLIAIIYYPEYGLTQRSFVSFIGAGVFGTLLGRACLYTSIDRIGASRTAPMVATWAFVSTVLGIIVLGESVPPLHAVGVVLIVGGIAVIAWETSQENPDNLARRELLLGLALPFGAAAAFGVEPIFAKFGLDQGTPAPIGVLIKMSAAMIGFVLYLRWHNALPGRNLLRSNDRLWLLLAGIANTLFILGYYAALGVAPVSIVTPIIITNSLFVVFLSAIFMPDRLERVTWRLAVAAIVVVIGVLVITVYG